jgi:putative transcriptional regulator
MQEKITNTVSSHRTSCETTQEELARSVGVSRQTIIALEKGNYTPSILLALKIAQHFKLPVEKIFKVSNGK